MTEEASGITEAELLAAVEHMAREQVVPCGSEGKPHVVHPRVLRNDGWVRCGNCFQLFRLPS